LPGGDVADAAESDKDGDAADCSGAIALDNNNGTSVMEAQMSGKNLLGRRFIRTVPLDRETMGDINFVNNGSHDRKLRRMFYLTSGVSRQSMRLQGQALATRCKRTHKEIERLASHRWKGTKWHKTW
jgi:hypothetical protein